ncbi:pilus assembly protein FimV [Pelomonas saccharophila]|uniref:Pilus assembly protein FimV n=1 Tax=Roseateles saccharophilus TaxID=304 RepID=A0ABU1YTG2_ROSSA|nr:FimV/HubP family polar landmark protein [Roseateles saccharophilus]MDR7272147.1 pilus assembly protein FimV [Roseateles saccharophilus]
MSFARHHLALAAALLVAGSGAQALGLGKLNVQSALGETMRAEIDLTSLTPEEAASLKVRVAPPEAYRTSGVEYNPVLTSTQVQVLRNNGRTVLRVSSDRSVQEPFVDVILELTWASGRLVREYTLLFDPPSLPKPAPVITAPPAVAAAPAPATAASSEAVPAPAPATTTALPRNGSAPAPAPVAAARPPAPAAVRPPVTAASEYAVRPGDSLSKIAARTQVSGISLDQMLVGLFRNNPDAFIDGNMNLLKAGTVLQVPSSESLASVPAPEARRVILAQSADFSAYRQRLASAAPTLQNTESERQSKGQVQAAVEDRKPAAAPTPDKLTLSKAGSTAASAAEAKLSKETEKKDAAARVAELTRNVEELKKLSSAAKPGAPTASAAAPATAPTPVAAPIVATAEPASAPASAPAVVAAASAPASRPAARASAPLAPPPVAEPPGLIEQLLDSPIVLPLAGVLVAVLGGLGLYRLRSRRPVNAAETGFHESRLQPDSFFGGTGGQRVDTRDAQNSGQSSMSYSLSQLDAIGDVDPVAEADVYLAYGRDLQAEEILKEALRANPTRLAIRLKLLEVYAKRRDTKGFEQLAVQLYAETKGAGEDWAKAQELGRGIDPDNPLYQPGGAPAHVEDGPELRPEPMNASTLPQTALPAGASAAAAAAAHLATDALRGGPDTGPVSGFDLALDLDLDAPEPVSPNAMAATQAMPASVEQAPMTMDFDISSRGTRTAPPAPDLSFDVSSMGGLTPAPATPAAASTDLDFDLGDSTLPGETTPEGLGHNLHLPDDEGDPLLRQLELADEFRQIGDTEGAREVLQELIQRASGPLRDKAQAMLNGLR